MSLGGCRIPWGAKKTFALLTVPNPSTQFQNPTSSGLPIPKDSRWYKSQPLGTGGGVARAACHCEAILETLNFFERVTTILDQSDIGFVVQTRKVTQGPPSKQSS
jgi:hypothetical protein